MIMYIVTVMIFIVIFINYFLGMKLYKEPKNEAYFSNVRHYNVIHNRDLMTSPKYVFFISALLGIFIGIYSTLGKMTKTNSIVIWTTIIILFVLYLVEISRKIVLNEENLEFERMFFKTKKIPLSSIDGIYIYSFNKKFIDKNAFTTKLVISTGNRRYKFTLSGINARAVLNMMKENFGISENKMYIATK